jgi:O-antigen ligase
MIEQATARVGNFASRAASLPLWAMLLAVTIAYIAIVTGDGYVLRVPFKLYLVAIALAAWWLQAGRHRRLGDYPLGLPVLAFAIAIPVVWSLVAAIQNAGGDPVGIHRLTWTLQEGSRFAYVLLYFPLVDARRALGAEAKYLWLLPVMALCLITVALFVSHYAFGRPDDTVEFSIFKGVFEGNPGGFRIFIGNQVLFIAALALLLAELAVAGRSRLRTAALALLLVSTYLSHTRGIWLGLSVVCAGILVVLVLREVSESGRRKLLASVGAVAGVGLLLSVAILADALPRPSFLADASAGTRVDQAPKLWDAFKSNPVLGDGLGAVIRPRFVRDLAAPWSYELTYLQILFQMGALGLLAVLSVPVAAAWSGLRAAVRDDLDPAPLAGGMAIVGVLVASATNPYLLSSFGMLSIVIGLSLIAPISASERPSDRAGALRAAVPASGST